MIPMKWFDRHPESRLLNRLADGELRGSALTRVQRHLETCADCRTRVSFLKQLQETAHRIPHPTPPRELLGEILASRAAGERVILPASTAPARAPRAIPVAAAAAATVVLAVGLSLVLASRAGAGASDLLFEPGQPAAGNVVELRYSPATMLAEEQTLRLRARYRTADDGVPEESDRRLLVAELRRGDEGHYKGSLRLPPSAVYATFAVEDVSGERVDANDLRLWDLLVHGAEGLPLPEALEEMYDELEGRNWRAATETAQRAADLYPDRAKGWALLWDHEMKVLEGSALDERRQEHLETFRRLETNALRSAGVPAQELAALQMYARLLEDSESADRLGRLLQERYPSHVAAIQLRIVEAVAVAPDDAARLAVLEEEWQRSGHAADVVPGAGFATAARLGDPEAIRQWAERLRRLGLAQEVGAARVLTEAPELREEGIDLLREVIKRIDRLPDGERPLHLSRSEFRERKRARIRELQGELATALVQNGRTAEGLDLLGAAAAQGWDPDVFRTAAEVKLAAGDTEAALDYAAMVAADPLADSDWVESIRLRSPDAEWDERLRAARLEMATRMLARAEPPRPFPTGLPVQDSGGHRSELAEVLAGRTTIVAFWHRHSYPFLQDLETLNGLSDLQGATGPRLISVSVEPPSDGTERFLERHSPSFPVYFDLDDRAASLLGVWATPAYVVVDRQGAIRHRTSDLAEATRMADVVDRPGAPTA
jgi:hypothetical protein